MSTDPLDALRGARVLLTGATGFVGRRVLERLQGLGVDPIAVSRHEPPSDLADAATWRRVDLADAADARRLVENERPEIVLHLASRVAGARDLDLVLPTLRDNLASTVHLLDGFARLGDAGTRFVQVGSLEEPDDPADSVPSSPYAASKAAASAYCDMFHRLWATPTVVARVFMVYGPGRQDERKLVPYVIRELLAGRRPSLSSGTRPVDWVFVDDVAEGLLRLAVADGVAGRRVDLGRGELTTVAEVVRAIHRHLTPAEPPSFGGREDRRAEQVRRADVEATRALLGWAPTVDLEDGLERAIAWFRAHPRAL
ncbi:MAG: NAD(P)-dependent oxidoreductase [Acidobacteriota bacterium]